MIAAMMRTITRTSTNWASRILHGLMRAVRTSSLGPIRANRRAASLTLRPKGEASSHRRTSSAGKECHSSASVRRTRARVIKVVPDIRRIRAIRRPLRLDNAYLYDESRCDPSGWEPRFSRGRFQRPRSPRTRTGKRVLVIETTSIMFDVGVIASVGFVGAAIASRVRLPILIGYIIAGILIGPNIHLRLLGASYDGILSDSVFLQSISQLGLVLLLFFVGLEFSITKLMKTKEAAAILAATNLAVNFFAGFVIGAWLGWPVIDTIFMAGVIGMSSSAIAAKSLIDLKRLGNKETEFLLGMVILESFLAMFILSFGMLIDLSALPSVLPMLIIAVPLILLNDLFLTASLAYFIGFSGRAATAIGTSMIARNEEAILYATVGARAIEANPQLSNDYAAKYLTPFAGILCIVMSSLAPILMKRSDRIATFFSNRLPKSITFGAELVKRTLKTVIMPNFLPIYRRKRVFQASLIAYAAWVIDLTITTGPAHFVMSVLTPVLVFATWASARHAFQEPVRHTNYGVDGGPLSRSAIETFVLRIVVGALAIVSLVAILWQYYWPVTLPILYAYFLVVVFSMKVVYRRLGLGVSRRIAPIRLVRRMPSARSWRAASGRR